MGENHGGQTPQDVDPMSNVSSGRAIRTPDEATEIKLMREISQRYWKAACSESCTCSLGEGSRKSTIARWQLVGFLSYIESHFNTVRKMADAKFARARSWEELIAIHRKWMRDYNTQCHFAHEKREDGCHSPASVLGGQKGKMYPESVLSRILFATRYVRRLDKNGFLRFQDWKFYGERGLPRAKVTVWIYEDSLKVEKEAVTLSEYEVSMLDDHKHVQAVRSARTHETPFRSPELTLFDLDQGDWLLYWKTAPRPRRLRLRRVEGIVQMPLFDFGSREKAVGIQEASGVADRQSHLHLVGEPDTSL
jgi:hypothetical protein